MCVYMCTCVYVCVYGSVCMYMCMYVYMCVHMCICICMYMYICVCMYVFIYICILYTAFSFGRIKSLNLCRCCETDASQIYKENNLKCFNIHSVLFVWIIFFQSTTCIVMSSRSKSLTTVDYFSRMARVNRWS